jgi:large subunit ribosomal protein L13
MKTVVVDPRTIVRGWYMVDATDVPLGRLASTVAALLEGKHKPAYSPNQDHGDNVVVINAGKVRFTGRKPDTKTYFRHSRQPGGGRVRTLREQFTRSPAWVLTHAVRGMLSRNKPLGRKILKKLHVYAGATHPHAAQKPQPFVVKG